MKKNKELIKIILIFVVSMVLIYYVCNKFLGIHLISSGYADIKEQIIPYLEYLRQNFFATHDLFPQLNMNYGLSQSYAVFYYYGMYNPILMISFLVPFLKITDFIQVIVVICVVLNFIVAYNIFNEKDNSKHLIFLGSAIVAGSGYAIFESGHYLMFGTSYTGLLLMILGTKKIFYENKSIIFIFGCMLVYLTNFTFMLAYVIYAGIYFLYLIIKEKKKIIFMFSKIWKLIVGSLFGLLLSSFVLLPQLFLIFSGGRFEPYVPDYPLFHNISDLAYYFDNGMFIMSYTILLILLIVLYKRKENIFTIVVIGIIVFFVPVFNFLQANESSSIKILIGINILLAIMFVEFLKEFKKNSYLNKVGLLTIYLSTIIVFSFPLIGIILTIFVILFRSKNTALYILLIPIITILVYQILLVDTVLSAINILYFIISFMLLVGYLYNIRYYYIIVSLFLIFSVLNFSGISDFELAGVDEEILNYNVNEYNEYRDIANNEFIPMGKASTNLYTSIENSHYYNHMNNILDYQKEFYQINIDIPVSKTTSIIYGIEGIYNNLEKKPMFYGTSNIYSIDDYLNTQTQYRLLKELQGIFIDDSTAVSPDIRDYISLVYKNDNKVNINYDDEKVFTTINTLGAGEYIISLDIDETVCENTNAIESININDNKNSNTYCFTNMYNHNDVFTYYIPVEENQLMTLEIPKNSNFSIDNIEVSFISDDELNSLSSEIYEIENFEADFNHGYQFDIQMDKAGYVNSTIPYDDGFTIYVDGNKVETIKSDVDYLAFKVDEGSHNIVIKYHIEGFYLGFLISIATGLLLTFNTKLKVIKI